VVVLQIEIRALAASAGRAGVTFRATHIGANATGEFSAA
jgi:hypothetical protein